MRFLIKTGRESAGKHLTRVEAKTLETDSFVPRTNRRKIRAWLLQEMHIHPTNIKKAMKMLNFWEPKAIGIVNYADRQAAIAASGDEASLS